MHLSVFISFILYIILPPLKHVLFKILIGFEFKNFPINSAFL